MRTENRRLDFIFFRAPLHCRKFFTLIELLITISIIALLSGMLLPSLMKARSSARSITCIGNLRQIGSIFHMYASDFDDWIIRGRTLSSAGTTTGLWLELMTKLNYQPEGADKKIRGGLFLCPEDQYPAYNPALVSSIRCSYGINTTIAQGMYGKIVDDPPGIDCRDRWRRFGALIGSVKKASNTPLVSDSWGRERGTDLDSKKYLLLRPSGGSSASVEANWFNPYTSPGFISLVHKERFANTLYCDGRVQAVRGPMRNTVNTAHKYVLWLNPDTADGINY